MNIINNENLNLNNETEKKGLFGRRIKPKQIRIPRRAKIRKSKAKKKAHCFQRAFLFQFVSHLASEVESVTSS